MHRALVFAVLLAVGTPTAEAAASTDCRDGSAVTLSADGWSLRGDLRVAPGAGVRPVALLLNKATGSRQVYEPLADRLAERGISSLRLDLRAHGDSTNLGRFVPGGPDGAALLDGSEHDIAEALAWLRRGCGVSDEGLIVVGASYSGEAMAQAARATGRPAAVYVALSPGSLSEETARSIDSSGSRWLVVRSSGERAAAPAVDRVRTRSTTAQVWVLEGQGHATDLLDEVEDLDQRLADWIVSALR